MYRVSSCTSLINLVGQQGSERHRHIFDPTAITDNQPRHETTAGEDSPRLHVGASCLRYRFLTLTSYLTIVIDASDINYPHHDDMPPNSVANTKISASIWAIPRSRVPIQSLHSYRTYSQTRGRPYSWDAVNALTPLVSQSADPEVQTKSPFR
jgi:hypothetical protein